MEKQILKINDYESYEGYQLRKKIFNGIINNTNLGKEKAKLYSKLYYNIEVLGCSYGDKLDNYVLQYKKFLINN